MGYRIDLNRKWPGRRDLLHPGVYRVPEDLPDELVQKMLAAGAATVVSAADEPVSVAEAPQVAAVSSPVPRKRKSRGKAPENKSAQD